MTGGTRFELDVGRPVQLLVVRDVPPVLARVLLLTRLDRVLRTTRTGVPA